MKILHLTWTFIGTVVLWLLCAFSISTLAFAVELPIGSAVIARWVYDDSRDRADYRGSDGRYYLATINRNTGIVGAVMPISLSKVRSDLNYIPDYATIGLSPLWGVDSDGDGHSDMQEYLTDGDPYDASIVPLTPWVKSYTYEGEVKILEVSTVPDMVPSGGDDGTGGDTDGESGRNAGGGTGENTVSDLGKIELLLTVLVHLVAVSIGLFFWRLFIISKSQKNLI